jgi:alpha-D-ribose 1-methylphosphonate 5-phosphate C-P lyase
MNNCPALQLFGAGREKRIYAIPPYTQVVSLDFEDHPFARYRFNGTCALCGATDSYLDEVITDDRGSRMFACSDTDHCAIRRGQGHRAGEGTRSGRELDPGLAP